MSVIRSHHRPMEPSDSSEGEVFFAPQAASVWMTPRQVAKERQIRAEKVLGWIRTGELRAVNMASHMTSKPRWKVSREALAEFDLARSNRAFATPTLPRRRKGSALMANHEKVFFQSP